MNEDEDYYDPADDRDDDVYDHDDENVYGSINFADPGGNSALRAATEDNPRDLPCPSCKRPDMLTWQDKARGYQCDSCADRAERGCD